MRLPSSIDDIVAAIQRWAAADNLAAVIVHMNDTYFIEERPPDIPGMPRVAGLVKRVRAEVAQALGEDRTLVLHSGDYLSPSYMSRLFCGQPMVDLLNACSVDVATLGNHEFDFGRETLEARLAQSHWTTVLGNLTAPSTIQSAGMVFWPSSNPFLAITGIAGQQTIEKAMECGFLDDPRTLRTWVRDVVEQARSRAGIGGLVVLSHMDRHEDKELQELLSLAWGKSGFAYLFGGHDHHIHWPEADQWYCVLSKCRSNCKSISVRLLPKDGIAAPMRNELARSRRSEATLSSPYSQADLSDDVIAEYREVSRGYRQDFSAAYERRIREVLGERTATLNVADYEEGTLAWRVTEQASLEIFEDGFRQGGLEIRRREHLFGLPVDPAAAQTVARWQAAMPSEGDANQIIIDCRAGTTESPELDASDRALRWTSTRYGNLCADAIKRETGADAVLLNSGAFRIDSRLPGIVTLRDLRDTFIYDGAGAIAVLDMNVAEIQAFYAYARERGGHGAFLQVSDSEWAISQRTGNLQVALVGHMLASNEDGYQSRLAELRGLNDVSDWKTAFGVQAVPKTMIELIRAGVVGGTTCSDEERLTATRALKLLERLEEEYLPLVDTLVQLAAAANISELDAERILRRDRVPEERVQSWDQTKVPDVQAAADAVRAFVGRLFFTEVDGTPFPEAFFKHLVHSERALESGFITSTSCRPRTTT